MTDNDCVLPVAVLRSGVYSNDGLDGVDADLILISDYLAGELPDDQERAFEDRLGTDEDFLDRFYPLMRFWTDRESKEEPRARASFRHTGRRVLQAAAIILVAVALPASISILGTTATRQYTLKQEVLEHRASTQSFWRPEMFDSVASVDAGSGVLVHLERGGRLTVDELHVPGRSPRIALDGDAIIEVPAGAQAVIETARGEIRLEQGRHAVHADAERVEFRAMANATTGGVRP